MKFIEFGIGNTWLIRTETEYEDGSEVEQKGIVGPIHLQSFYLRIWIGRTVWILDTKQGMKKSKKNRKAFKIILGIVSL